MAQLYKVVLYLSSLLLSMVTLIIMSSVKESLQKYSLKINKLALFRLENILINQIPSYQALVFAVYIPFCAYYIWNYIRERKRYLRIERGVASFEEKYLLDVESKEAKQWSNILLTNLFIYLTQTLALFLAIFFCSFALSEIDYIDRQYENTTNANDRDTVENVVSLKSSLITTIALNSLCILQIGFISFEGCYNKVKSK